MSFREWLGRCPLVAILRGVKPSEVVRIVTALYESGIRIVEVPMNSPDPLASIALLAGRFGDDMLVGAGTVLEARQVERISDAGGKLVVMPHADTTIVASARELGLFVVPGFSTPTEAFASLAAGADALKLFPAEANPPAVLKAMRAVLPPDVPVLPVGSISPTNMAEYWSAGASGFGLGSSLYRPGADVDTVAANATTFVSTIRLLERRTAA
ncbi:MAG: 2-dehydro-3-deoxy-6-phosphogalactonate aldolase [Betaproteobacteria bacterium]|nr:2-dehydro-3-deoxy-6-phosphogalactonate aldolase [Betaproteobacteria bacterium]